MKVCLMLQVLLASLLFGSFVHSVTISPQYDFPDIELVNFIPKQPLKLSCNITVEKNEDIQIKWLLNGTVLPASARVKINTVGNTYILKIEVSDLKDIGEYSCAAFSGETLVEKRDFEVISKFFVKTPTNEYASEGESVNITCHTVGNPLPKLHWVYTNDKVENVTLVAVEGKIQFFKDEKTGVDDSIVSISNIQMDDRGKYICIGTSEVTHESLNTTCMLRVKGTYAPLWPFLGICAEFAVLFGVICFCKKDGEADGDESDTDTGSAQRKPEFSSESSLRRRN